MEVQPGNEDVHKDFRVCQVQCCTEVNEVRCKSGSVTSWMVLRRDVWVDESSTVKDGQWF